MEQKYEELLKQYKCPLCKAKLKIVFGKKKVLNDDKPYQYEFIGCSRFPYCQFSTTKEKIEEWKNYGFKVLDNKFYLKNEYDINLPKKLADLLIKNKKLKMGFVYVIRVNDNNLIKIGKAKNFIERLSSLNKKLDGITPIWIIQTRFYSAMEVFLHSVFDDFLSEKKEFFKIPPEYLIEITKIKTFLGEKVKVIDKFNKPLLEMLEKQTQNQIETKILEDIDKGRTKRKKFWKNYYKDKQQVK